MDDTIKEITNRVLENSSTGDSLHEVVRKAVSAWVQKHTELFAVNSSVIIDYDEPYEQTLRQSLVEDLGKELLFHLHPKSDESNKEHSPNAYIRNYHNDITGKEVIQCDFITVDVEAVEDLCDIKYEK
jgi:hypothetical protein